MPKRKENVKRKRRRARARAKGRKLAEIRVLPSNRELALVETLMRAPKESPKRHLQIQDLVYNTAQELQMLAFKSGFNLGVEAYRHSDRSMAPLEHILENAGLGKVVFYPFESKSIISSRSIKSGGMNIGANLHIFESGVISGYLTAHAKKRITAREQTCVFNGASTCEFVATAGDIDSIEQAPLDFPAVLSVLSRSISGAESHTSNGAYYMMSIKPLLNEPVFSEATKFMYITGKMLSKNLPNFEHSIVRAANLLEIGKVKVSKGKKGQVTVSLGYTHYTSLNKYVDLSTALLAGMMKGALGNGVKLTRSVDAKGTYKVRMQMMKSYIEE